MENSDSVSFHAYEEMAEYYFKYVDTKAFNAYYERPATLSLLPSLKGRNVLDVACAAGWYTKWLIDQKANVTAMDFSPAMVAMTKKRVGDSATIIQADLNDGLDFFEDQSFDLILSSLTLHYIKDWEPVMKEFYRILKMKGHFVFSVHHPFMDYLIFNREDYFAIDLIEDTWATHKGDTKVQFYRRPLKEILSPLLKSGFTLEILDEPMPTDDFQKVMPAQYERLIRRPQFLFIRARKN